MKDCDRKKEEEEEAGLEMRASGNRQSRGRPQKETEAKNEWRVVSSGKERKETRPPRRLSDLNLREPEAATDWTWTTATTTATFRLHWKWSLF